LVNTVIVSLILAVITFTVGYYFYSTTMERGGYIRVEPTYLVKVNISYFNHTAVEPISNTTVVHFTLRGTENALAFVNFKEINEIVPMNEISKGEYTLDYAFESVNESMNISVEAILMKLNNTVRLNGRSIHIDVSPPEISAISTDKERYGTGEVITFTIRSEENATLSLDIKTIVEGIPCTETEPGVYIAQYTVKNGDDRKKLDIVIHTEDYLGNKANIERTMNVSIDTPGPSIFGLETNVTKPLTFGESVEFRLHGEKGCNATFEVIGFSPVTKMAETAPGIYKGEYTFDVYGIEKKPDVRVVLTKDGNQSIRIFTPIELDSLPPIILSISHNAISPLKSGDVLEVTLEAEPGGTAKFKFLENTYDMEEVEPGLYVGTYKITDENTEGAEVIGIFKDRAGNLARSVAAKNPVIVDTIVPTIVGFKHNIKAAVGMNFTVNVSFRSEPEGIATFDISNVSQNIVMEEVEPGVYMGTYRIENENLSIVSWIFAKFVDKAGNIAEPIISSPFYIDTIPPTIEDVWHNATKSLLIGETIEVWMRGEPECKAWFELRDINATTNYSVKADMEEVKPGLYRGIYTIQPNDTLENAVVLGYLEDEAGNKAIPFLVQPSEKPTPFQLNTLLGITFLILIIPSFVYYYKQYKNVIHYEDAFPDFLSDLHSIMGSQLPLPTALKIIKNSDYGPLSKLINKLNNRIELGVPFPEAFKKLGEETKSDSIKSAITVLISAYKAGGGRLSQIFGATAFNFRHIRNLKKKRMSELQIHIISGYIIFIVFLGVLVILNNSLFVEAAKAQTPFMGNASSGISIPGVSQAVTSAAREHIRSRFTDIMFYLFLIQAFFSGISIGELTEGNFMAGLKHAVILMVIALFAANFLA